MIIFPDAWTEISFKTLGSSMEQARKYIQAEGADKRLGIRITTEHQSQGRGRNPQARWIDDPGKNVLCTYAVPCVQNINEVLAYSPRTALAVAHCVQDFVSAPVQFKWPNDVFCSGKKIAGILLENYREYLLIGIGINVNQTHFSLPATSMVLESGRVQELKTVYDSLTKQLKAAYTNPQWQRAAEDILLGKDAAVEMRINDTILARGTLRGLTAQGFLLIEEQGIMRTMHQGNLCFL